jgi:RNA recognition motif-containing protein
MAKLKCKKCNGNHLTIKCGKKKISPRLNKKFSVNKFSANKKLTCVKISNIPNDLTIYELKDLTQEWGHIGKINFNNSIYNKSAFIDFYNKYEAEHFVKALDKTPFDNYMLDVMMLTK